MKWIYNQTPSLCVESKNISEDICHLIWQRITGQVDVTRNLIRRYIKCDNYCPRCGHPEETAIYAIFEYPPTLQVWSLASTPSVPNIFPLPNIYANMDYLFWRKNDIAEP